jgi:hypothetical protein
MVDQTHHGISDPLGADTCSSLILGSSQAWLEAKDVMSEQGVRIGPEQRLTDAACITIDLELVEI